MRFNLEDFLHQCNHTPLLIEYRHKYGDITANTLKKNGFDAEIYELNDLFKLVKELLDFKWPEEPKELEKIEKIKRSTKDLRHKFLIQKIENQNFIMSVREDINMPFPNKGFLIKDPGPKKKRVPALYPHYTNTNFGFSSEYKNWFFGNSKRRISFDEWQSATATKHQQVSTAVDKVLKKWRLPRRYKNAIQELILFNRIIPASSGITWSRTRPDINGEWTEAITYDADTSKEELINTIRRDELGILKNKKKHLPGGKNVRTKRKSAQTKEMLEYYNKQTKDGVTKKEIYRDLSGKYNISVSAIKKRLANN